MNKYIYFCIILIVGCTSIPYENMTLYNKYAFRNEAIKLRKDGYYYYEKYIDGKYLIRPVFFYYDGSVASSGYISSKTGYEDSHSNVTLKVSEYNEKYKYDFPAYFDWGVYTIDSNIITIQYFTTNSYAAYLVIEKEGIVLNDSSFVIKNIFIRESSDKLKIIEADVNHIFRYREYRIKPDSLNWVKEAMKKEKK